MRFLFLATCFRIAFLVDNNNGFRVASTLTARVAAFTDAAREQRVRPGPAMLSGRREWFAAPSRAAAVLPDT